MPALLASATGAPLPEITLRSAGSVPPTTVPRPPTIRPLLPLPHPAKPCGCVPRKLPVITLPTLADPNEIPEPLNRPMASPRIVAISWGIEDLGAAMGLPRVRDAEGRYLDIPRFARTMCALAAAAAGVDALDTVYTDIADLAGLRRECEDAVAMAFSGKISIHPGQIGVINEAFTPAAATVAEAHELAAAFEEHRRRGVFAFRFKGQMVDAPHLSRALKVIARSRG